MKKIYKNPETKVFSIVARQSLMAGSPGYGGSTEATSGNLAPDFSFDEEGIY